METFTIAAQGVNYGTCWWRAADAWGEESLQQNKLSVAPIPW